MKFRIKSLFKKKSFSLLDLPNDIFFNIFSFLDKGDFKQAKKTCKRINELFKHKHFQELEITAPYPALNYTLFKGSTFFSLPTETQFISIFPLAEDKILCVLLYGYAIEIFNLNKLSNRLEKTDLNILEDVSFFQEEIKNEIKSRGFFHVGWPSSWQRILKSNHYFELDTIDHLAQHLKYKKLIAQLPFPKELNKVQDVILLRQNKVAILSGYSFSTYNFVTIWDQACKTKQFTIKSDRHIISVQALKNNQTGFWVQKWCPLVISEFELWKYENNAWNQSIVVEEKEKIDELVPLKKGQRYIARHGIERKTALYIGDYSSSVHKIIPLENPTYAVCSLGKSKELPNGNIAAVYNRFECWGHDTYIHIWDDETGKCLKVINLEKSDGDLFTIFPGGRFLTANETGKIATHSFEPFKPKNYSAQFFKPKKEPKKKKSLSSLLGLKKH